MPSRAGVQPPRAVFPRAVCPRAVFPRAVCPRAVFPRAVCPRSRRPPPLIITKTPPFCE
ncbi:protein of unknown function (plasmid) [Azospirillum baldaniorum]|uniref:Uncharacterized protein n=1 Tax=Azospirillum baldaniorum TaxID=1064539 RepID=A0A9P1NQZ9_9PROT|nr:protein of unknown function [Azospirillum baldaniorum]